MDDQQTRDELNRRYWESDASVSAIADELDISRRALYEGIDPLPAGVPCPVCGGSLGFRNRTAAENQEAECAECGREMPLEDALGATGAADEAGDSPADTRPGRRRPPRPPRPPEIEQERSAAAMSPISGVPDSGNGVVLGSLVLLGLGVGALAAYLVRQRE